jgi:M6 family metalloprotease-like protein
MMWRNDASLIGTGRSDKRPRRSGPGSPAGGWPKPPGVAIFPSVKPGPRLLVLLAVAPVLPVPGWGQQVARGEVGRFEVFGLDWGPESAWRRRAAEIRQTRQALLRAGRMAELNQGRAARLLAPGAAPASPFVLTGTIHIPVVPVAYANVPVAYPRTEFQDILFSPDPASIGRAYTLKSYYEELSSGLLQIEGRVFDPVRVANTAEYYQDNCNGIGVVNTCPNGLRPFRELLLAVLDSLSNAPGGDTLWSRFDNDGPDGIPNSGDDDGFVDMVAFLQPVVDGACGGHPTQPGIWAHRWNLTSLAGQPYVTKTPRRDASGNPIPGQFIRINEYTIQSQLGGASGCGANAIMPIGTIAHETGHIFGLPDLYDTGPAPRSQGIGHWGLMGSGNYAMPYSPASYEAWSLAELGWVTITELTGDAVITTGARQLTDSIFLARTGHPSQYFLIENRQAVHSDTAQMGPAALQSRKAPGLLVWLIDDNRIAVGRGANRVNTGPVHGVALMQADGRNDLRRLGSANRGDTGDPYPGSTGNTRFGFGTNPSARINTGAFAGFLIDRVEQLANHVIRFRFTRRQPTLIRPAVQGPEVRVNGEPTGRFEEVVPEGDVLHLAVDTSQMVGNRTLARFLAWSIGGAVEQVLVSGPVPDTVIALFAMEHRLVAVTEGGGTFASSIAGDLAGGVFLPAGTPVTLTAAAPPGFDFVMWQGDTASVNLELRLTMERPYDVAALFVPTRPIPVVDATLHLLGTPRLHPDDLSYLDQLGNRNGIYDVGDYLAFLHRTGSAPPALGSGLLRRDRP